MYGANYLRIPQLTMNVIYIFFFFSSSIYLFISSFVVAAVTIVVVVIVSTRQSYAHRFVNCRIPMREPNLSMTFHILGVSLFSIQRCHSSYNNNDVCVWCVCAQRIREEIA